MHEDQHTIVFESGSSQHALIGCDGGVFYSTNFNATTPAFINKNGSTVNGYRTSQFYSCAMDPTSGSNTFLGGTQDNGTQTFNPPGSGIVNSALGLLGDGGYCFIDNYGTGVKYIASTQYANFDISTSGQPNTFNPLVNHGIPSGRFIVPADYDYTNHILFYSGGQGISRVDGILTGVYADINLPTTLISSFPSAIKVSPYSPPGSTNVFVATSDWGTALGRQFFKIEHANTIPNFIQKNVPITIPSAYISCIEIGEDENQILLTYSSYGLASKVFESLDGGNTWTSKGGNFQDMPVWWALYNPLDYKEVLIATELGVWSTTDITVSSPVWNETMYPTPTTRVTMLRYRASDNLVLAATYGRGLFATNFFNHPIANFSIPIIGGCNNTTMEFTDLSTNSPQTWSWDFGDGTASSFLQNPVHTFQQPGFYIVTLTVSNTYGCNSFSMPVIIQDGSSCCATFTPSIDENNFNSGISITGGYNLSGISQNIAIHSPNTAIISNNARIAIPEGFSITIESGATLSISSGSQLFACGNMWKGIVVESGGTLTVDNSAIKDAEYAIQAKDGSVVTIDNATFENDYIGVYYGDPLTHASTAVQTSIVNSNFTCTGTLRPPYNGQLTTPLTRTYAGIYLDNVVGISIGTGINFTTPTLFEGLNFGIYSRNSNSIVRQCRFRQIKNYDPGYSPVQNNGLGSGIYAKGYLGTYILNQVGLNDPNVYDFEECQFGIYGSRVSVNSTNNYIFNCDVGCKVEFAAHQDITINDNHIECNLKGIWMHLNDPVRNLSVLRNVIRGGDRVTCANGWQEAKTIGILLNDAAINSHLKGVAYNNIDLHDNGAMGILMMNGNNYNVTNNTVLLSNIINIGMKGISIINSNHNTISCNTVNGSHGAPFTMSSPEVGFEFTKSPSNLIHCNLTNNTSTGFRFTDDCSGGGAGQSTEFKSNDIGNHWIGLHYTGSANVDAQTLEGNLWFLPIYPGLGNSARNDNTLGAQYSKYYYDFNGPSFALGAPGQNSTATNDPDYPAGQIFPSFWFGFTYGVEHNCNESTGSTLLGFRFDCNNETGGGGGGNLADDIRMAQDQFGSVEFDEETRWKGKVALYEKLLKMPELLDSSSVLANFFTSFASTSIQKIASLNVDRSDLFANQGTVLQNIEDNAFNIYHQSEMIRTCDSLLDSGSLDETEKDSINLYRENLIQTIKATISYNESAFSSLDSSISVKSDLLNTENDNINGNEIYEANAAIVNYVYLHTMAVDRHEGISDYAVPLLSVAQQCPIAGGPAVHLARALYMQIDPNMVYYDELTCVQQGYAYRYSHQGSLSKSSLYPDPASSNVTLVYAIKEESRLQITDGFGRIVSYYKLLPDRTSFQFKIDNLGDGMYYYRILDVSGFIKDSGRFVVMK